MRTKAKAKPPIIVAPMWLVRRMENLQRMPPPTLKEVAAQFRASTEFRKKLIGKPTG